MQSPSHLKRANLIGIFWMISSMAAFSVEDALLKAVTQHLPLGQVLMLFGASGAVVFALLARLKGADLFDAEVFTRLMLLRAVFEFFGRLFYVLAVVVTPISSATAILQATPLLVVLGATVFFRERVSVQSWVAIAAGLSGVLIIIRPSGDDFTVLSLLAVVGTLGFVGRDLATRAASPKVTTQVLGFYGFSTLCLAGACFAAWEGKPFVALTSDHWVTLSATLVTGVFAYTALMTAMRTGSIAAVTPFRYSRLLFGLSIGVFIFGEQPTLLMLLGCVVVIAAGLFIGWRGQRDRV